eukprot:UN0617
MGRALAALSPFARRALKGRKQPPGVLCRRWPMWRTRRMLPRGLRASRQVSRRDHDVSASMSTLPLLALCLRRPTMARSAGPAALVLHGGGMA